MHRPSRSDDQSGRPARATITSKWNQRFARLYNVSTDPTVDDSRAKQQEVTHSRAHLHASSTAHVRSYVAFAHPWSLLNRWRTGREHWTLNTNLECCACQRRARQDLSGEQRVLRVRRSHSRPADPEGRTNRVLQLISGMSMLRVVPLNRVYFSNDNGFPIVGSIRVGPMVKGESCTRNTPVQTFVIYLNYIVVLILELTWGSTSC